MKSLLRLSVVLTLLFCNGCTHVFYQPDKNLYFPPEKNGYDVQDVYFKSLDGVQLHAWFIPAKQKHPKGTIIQFHGNAQNLSSHYAALVWLTREGYNLFTFDYRGYGQSDGEPSQEGIYKDGMVALDEAWKFHKKSHAGKFIVYGQSLGGAVAMRSFADFRHQQETALLVMDSTFSSYKDVAQQKLASFWFSWIFSPLGQVLVSDKYASEKVLSKVKTRLLVIHDKRDPVVDFKNGKHIFEKYTGPKEFWELENGFHIGVFWTEKGVNRPIFLQKLSAI